jgi:hypothetical protein
MKFSEIRSLNFHLAPCGGAKWKFRELISLSNFCAPSCRPFGAFFSLLFLTTQQSS